MSHKKRNRKRLPEDRGSNETYLQTDPVQDKMPGSKNPRQSPRNLPTENANMHEDLSNEILSEADRRAHENDEETR
jgi:hypothetical protein